MVNRNSDKIIIQRKKGETKCLKKQKSRKIWNFGERNDF